MNFGSADGCPLAATYYCSWGWNQGDYFNFSYYSATFTPEVYYPGMAQQWSWIQTYAGKTMYPEGPLDDNDLDPNSYTSDGAWTQLSPYFPYMWRSLEMHIAQ